MKEEYFTGAGIEATLARLVAGLEQPARGPAFDPATAALLILDMQGYFLDSGSHAFVPSAPAIVPALERLARALRAAGRPVIATRHVNTPADAGMLGRWWQDLVAPGSPEARLEPRLEQLATRVLEKGRYDAFHGTDLELLLEVEGTRQVVVTGVMTHLCVETTARSAFVRDYAVFIPADATATYTREFHRGSLLGLAHGVARVVTAREILAAAEVAKAGSAEQAAGSGGAAQTAGSGGKAGDTALGAGAVSAAEDKKG